VRTNRPSRRITVNRPGVCGPLAFAGALVMARVFLRVAWTIRALPFRITRPRRDEANPLAPASLVTTVLRLPPPIACQLRACTSELEVLEPDHYYYPPESMHVTLAAPGSTDDERTVVANVQAIAPRLVGARARVLGVGLTKRTLFAVILPDQSLLAARRSLRQDWGRPRRRPRPDLVFGLVWYANLVRFRVDPSPQYLGRARKARSFRSGWFELPAVEVVRTNKVMSSAATVVLAKIVTARVQRSAGLSRTGSGDN
jgi:hypothetical protein